MTKIVEKTLDLLKKKITNFVDSFLIQVFKWHFCILNILRMNKYMFNSWTNNLVTDDKRVQEKIKIYVNPANVVHKQIDIMNYNIYYYITHDIFGIINFSYKNE